MLKNILYISIGFFIASSIALIYAQEIPNTKTEDIEKKTTILNYEKNKQETEKILEERQKIKTSLIELINEKNSK